MTMLTMHYTMVFTVIHVTSWRYPGAFIWNNDNELEKITLEVPWNKMSYLDRSSCGQSLSTYSSGWVSLLCGDKFLKKVWTEQLTYNFVSLFVANLLSPHLLIFDQLNYVRMCTINNTRLGPTFQLDHGLPKM